MKKRYLSLAAVAGLVAVLAIGATTALAHGGRGGPLGARMGLDLLTPAAKSLGVTKAALEKAILDDAKARIDKAVKDGRIDEDQAADLEDDLAASPQRAIPLTTATGVARNLGTTKAKLDDAFRAARKAEIVARIDQAVKDGRITAEQAADMKAALDDAQLPGYRGGHGFGGPHGGGFGGPRGGMGGPHGGGMGGGPGFGLGGVAQSPASAPL